MSTKLLRESIRTSETIDLLSWFEEVLFYRLIVTCDDFGRYDGRTKIIKGSCFPLKDITEKDVRKALGKLSKVGLIIMYEKEGKPYLQIVTWGKYQRVRNQKSKYPEFEKNSCELLIFDGRSDWIKESADKCDKQIYATCDFEETTDIKPCSKAVKPSRKNVPEVVAVITLTLNTGEEYPITQSYINELVELYPAVDVMQELRSMKGWCNANPQKRKTARGIKKFVNSWIARVQDKGGSIGYKSSGTVQNTCGMQEAYGGRLDELLSENRGDFDA